jgi:hypothetical protein
MIVRNINHDEVDKYCRVGLEEKRALEFKDRILKAWEEKRSYPEWFFVIEEGGKFIGRLGFDMFLSDPLNLMVWGLVIPDEKDYFEAGEKLFKGALESLSGKGLKLITHHLYEKDNKKFSESRELFLRVGFTIQQEKFSYRFTDGSIPKLSDRLIFKTLKEVGEEEFINAMIRVTKGTLDSFDARDVARLGEYRQAQDSFNGLKDLDYNEKWWKLAYEPNGDFAGLILSQKFNNGRHDRDDAAAGPARTARATAP